VDESGPVGHGLVSAGQPGAGVPSLGIQVYAASSGRSAASLRALLPDSPQEVRDVRTQDDQAEVPEAEAYANIGASISLPDLAVGPTQMSGHLLVPQPWMLLPPQMSGQP